MKALILCYIDYFSEDIHSAVRCIQNKVHSNTTQMFIKYIQLRGILNICKLMVILNTISPLLNRYLSVTGG